MENFDLNTEQGQHDFGLYYISNRDLPGDKKSLSLMWMRASLYRDHIDGDPYRLRPHEEAKRLYEAYIKGTKGE